MAGPSFEQIQKGIPAITEQLKQSHQEAQGVSDAFGTLLQTLLPIKAGLEGVKWLVGASAGHLRNVNVGLQQTSLQLRAAREVQFQSLHDLRNEGKISAEVLTEHLELLKEQNKTFEAQVRLADAVANVGAKNLALVRATLAVMVTVVLHNRQLNQNLINANSHFLVRNGLMRDSLMLQVQTGASFAETTEAAQALAFWGAENLSNFQEVVKTVHRLNAGLGMSIQLGAELAAVVERRIGGNFEKVADVMAALVNDTALTADEAGRLALNLARVMETVKPGVAATALPEVSKLVGGYESAIKRMGGQAGMVEQWLSKLTTPEGLMGAGALGVNPEFIQSQAGVERVMKNFQIYAEGLLQNAEGWDRRWRLDALGQQMGLTADQASILLKVMQEQGSETAKEITLQERFKQQIASTGEGVVRLGNTLLGLVQGALYPLMRAVSAVINVINEGLQMLMDYKPVVYVVMTAVGVGIVALAGSMWRLVVALWDVFAASRAASIQLAIQARAQAANQAMLPGFGGAGAGGGIVAAFATASAPMLLALGALVALTGALVWWASAEYKLMKQAQAAEREAADKLSQSKRGFVNRIGSDIVQDVRYGNMDYWRGEGQKRLADFLSKVPFASRIAGYDQMTKAQQVEATKKANKEFIEEVYNAQYNRIRFDQASPYSKPTKVDSENIAVMRQILIILSQSAATNVKALETDIKRAEDAKVQAAQDALRNGQIVPNRNQMFY